MTQKDKLIQARIMATVMKSIAASLRSEAREYDVRWPLSYADALENTANNFLKLK